MMRLLDDAFLGCCVPWMMRPSADTSLERCDTDRFVPTAYMLQLLAETWVTPWFPYSTWSNSNFAFSHIGCIKNARPQASKVYSPDLTYMYQQNVSPPPPAFPPSVRVWIVRGHLVQRTHSPRGAAS
jgi:hypothetical protein